MKSGFESNASFNLISRHLSEVFSSWQTFNGMASFQRMRVSNRLNSSLVRFLFAVLATTRLKVNTPQLTSFSRFVYDLGCKYHLTVQDGKHRDTPLGCDDQSPGPALLTNTSVIRRISVCIEHALQEVLSCKPDMRNSSYFNKGRWRRMWRLDSSQKTGSETSLKMLLLEVISDVNY